MLIYTHHYYYMIGIAVLSWRPSSSTQLEGSQAVLLANTASLHLG
jgi:hypothetical protein